VKRAIEELLNERFFVPVLRSSDSSVQPVIGEPFTTSNMPTHFYSSPNHDPRSPSMEIKAYAGPMSSEQAQSFRKRWKTPPRLIPTATACNSAHNLSFSPKSSAMSSPLHSPRMTKSFHNIQSTPKLKKRLFDGHGDAVEDFESVYKANINESDKNGNSKIVILDEHEEEEFRELFDDLMKDKMEYIEEINGKFKAYRNPEPSVPETPIRTKNDSNSNHLVHSYNSLSRLNSNDSLFCNPPSGSIITTFLDESGSIYSQDNIHDSISFKEKNLRLTDTAKGLEKIGRGLASEYKVGWKEYWDFLGLFIDIRGSGGLEAFEEHLKKRDKQKEVNESEEKSPVKQNDSFGLSAICAGFYSMDINDEISSNNGGVKKNGLTSPLTARSPLIELLSTKRKKSNELPLDNPYTCIEQSCRTFAKRLASLLEGESIQDQNSYEKVLLAEVNKLNTSIESYKRDIRFISIDFQKVHARYSYLLVWYLKNNNINVKYLRNAVPLISKVYNLARQFASLQDTKDLIRNHSLCISNFVSNFIEHEEKIFNPENVNSETGCYEAWNGPSILQCKCSFQANFASTKQRQNHRRDIRKRLYSGKTFYSYFMPLFNFNHCL
jgi:ankyrin repeat and LEM domain-containing protein 2